MSTGLPVFDDALLGGVRQGDLIVVSGISGHGKTSFAQTLTYNLAHQSVPCLWFSYEVNLSHIQRKFDNMSGDKIAVRTLPIFAPTKTTSGRVDWIADKIRQGVKEEGIKCVFIDHLDFLVPTTVKTSENESLHLKRIVMELKSIAQQEGVCIFLMAHVKKVSDEPEMSDIANSASIFQNADVVFIVFRIAKEQSKLVESSGDLFTNATKIKMVKNRVTGQSKFIRCEMVNDQLIEIVDIDDIY
jgi:replicative DNA helicase